MRRTKKLPLEQLAPYLLPDAPRGSPAPPIVWRELFGNDNPVEVEVGFGKGLHLVNAGAARPYTNFFGVEIIRKYQLYAATRLALRHLTNVRVACADGRALLRDRVSPTSVDAVHVYFPDPWWKARHRKRRVFTPEFAQQAWRVLRPGGQLLVVTDVPDYAQMVRETVAGHTAFAEAEPPAEHQPGHDMDYLTNFERKFRREGKPIWRMRFVKP